MRRRSSSLSVRVALFLSLPVLMLLVPGPTTKRTAASSSTVLKPMTGKSIEQFVRDAYAGVGLSPSCTAVRNESAALAGLLPNDSSAFEQEARRFDSTLIETQTSYDTDEDTEPFFVETSTYSARNPIATSGHGDSSGFVTDLYHAFLQRNPDSGGLAYWIGIVNFFDSDAYGRRYVIDAFGAIPDDAEFTNLVHSLYDDGRVCCPVNCHHPGWYYDCDLGYCTPL